MSLAQTYYINTTLRITHLRGTANAVPLRFYTVLVLRRFCLRRVSNTAVSSPVSWDSLALRAAMVSSWALRRAVRVAMTSFCALTCVAKTSVWRCALAPSSPRDLPCHEAQY